MDEARESVRFINRLGLVTSSTTLNLNVVEALARSLEPSLFECNRLIEIEVLRLGSHVLQGGTGVVKTNSL